MRADSEQGGDVTVHTPLRTGSSEGPGHQAKGKWKPCDEYTMQSNS